MGYTEQYSYKRKEFELINQHRKVDVSEPKALWEQ